MKLIFRLLDRAPDKTIGASELRTFIHHMVRLASRATKKASASEDDGEDPSQKVLAESLMHELTNPGESAKNCLYKR